MDNQNTIVQPSVASAGPMVQSNNSLPQKKNKGKAIFIWLIIVVLLGALGYLGYTYKTTNDTLRKKSQDLSSAYKTIKTFQGIIDKNKAEKDFIAQNNNPEMSRRICKDNAVLMSDVHVNDKFATFRYLCANSAYPIRIGAMKKLPNNTYEFTYGDSTSKTNLLPSYIYDSEPDFFGRYGVTRF